MARMARVGSLAGIVGAVAAVLVLLVVLSAVHLLPRLRNPFAETTTVRTEPVILKSITELSRYEAASGSFEVVVDLTRRTSLLPSFLAGRQTLFIGQGTDIAYVDFSQLKSQAIQMNAARTSVTVSLPKAQQKIQAAARQSPLLSEAQKNTEGMLDGMLTSLGFQHVTVTFGGTQAS
jgi:Protein of unknown function (DUF4230)